MTNLAAQVAIQYDIFGRQSVNTFHCIFDDDDEGKVNDLQGIVDEVGATWSVNIMPHLNEYVLLSGVAANRVTSDDWAFNPLSVQGGSTSPGLPMNCAYLVRKVCPTWKRGGRMFLPGVPEAGAGSDGSVPASVRSGLNGALSTVFTALTDAGIEMYVRGWTGPEVGNTVSALVVDSKIATQRRRLR